MNPWIDYHDLIWLRDTEGAESGYPDSAFVSLYTWRDTTVRVVLDNTTMEVLDIYEEA